MGNNCIFFKRKISYKITAVAVVALFLQFCTCTCTSGPSSSIGALNDKGATAQSKAGLISANNQFALEFYSRIKDQEAGKNSFFSPYSISTAMGMTYEGARHETAREIQSVFHFSEENSVRRASVAAVYNQLNKNQGDYTLSTANALWIQKDYPLLSEVTEVVSQYYGGHLSNLDFINKTEQSRNTINEWIKDQTQEKIVDAIQHGVLGPLTRIVLTNAIYFKGSWEIAFAEGDTKEEAFRVSAGQTVQAPMMSIAGKEFGYTETQDVQILEMPYKGDNISMLVLLPKNDDMESLERGLDINKLSEWSRQLKKQEMDVYIPKFSFKSGYDLKELLKEMGMPLAFTPPEKDSGADFSGFVDKKELYISTVKHLAVIDVNEEGTEAAAATVVVMKATSVRRDAPPVFRADHPFIFLIREKQTGHILFMGKVINPLL